LTPATRGRETQIADLIAAGYNKIFMSREQHGGIAEARSAIRLVCLDFDGTIMTYDEPAECFHPAVIDCLNHLLELGVNWCTNSGRDMESQVAVLEQSYRKGLHHRPVALMCCESLIYTQSNGAYIPLEPWNSRVREEMTVFHRQVQHLLEPHLQRIGRTYEPFPVLVGEHYTAFQVADSDDRPLRLYEDVNELLASVPGIMISRNGGWIAVLAEHLGKGNILGDFASRAGYDRAEILAVGDQFNDLNMLDGAVAMHAGCPADAIVEVRETVRTARGYVARAQGPLGTVEAIEHFLRSSV
jgi:hydroxymethylpyrimidine pyrophosphatase-like HAD family hydrolase